MKNRFFDRLLSFSIFFVALWFFGNLYEEIVLTPNHIINSYEKLQLWQQFFTVTNPMLFYVPFTQIAVVVLCILYFKTSDKEQKQFLKRASLFGILGLVITAAIVTQINFKIYFGDLDKYKDQLKTLSIIWLIGNAVRICLVGTSLYYSIKIYILRKTT